MPLLILVHIMLFIIWDYNFIGTYLNWMAGGIEWPPLNSKL